MNRDKIFPVITTILLALLIIGGGIWGLRLWDQQQLEETVPVSQNNPQPLVGSDQDEYGCLASAGYGWCEASQKCLRIFEEFCPDIVTNITRVINQNTGIVFTGPGEKNFNWITGNEQNQVDVEVNAVSYQAVNVTMAGVEAIESFLNNLAAPDPYNSADGFEGGQRGYYLNYVACVFDFRHDELVEGEEGQLEPVGDDLDIELACGYFNHNDIPQILALQDIKELFAEKYDRDIDEINLTVSKNTSEHLRGGVKFGDGLQGEGGIFFAAKVDNEWQLVFDGNGMISCDLLNQYNFPEEFQADCAPSS
jgi:hypothetical protein